MERNGVHIVKLGGSMLTEKDTYHKVREWGQTMDHAASQLSEFSKPLVIVHGAGSFGHIFAHKGKIKDGENPSIKEQMECIRTILHDMAELNLWIAERLACHGITPCPFSTRAFYYLGEKGLVAGDITPLKRALDAGMVPLLHGDVVFDTGPKKFTILSGDDVVFHIANELGASSAVFATNVDGIYLDWPDNSVLCPRITEDTLRMLEDRAKNEGKDVTGGMKNKAAACLELAKHGIPSAIVNGAEGSALERALAMDMSVGSWALPGRDV